MKAALVTGAAGAIGAALCQAFQEAGYHVVATDVAPGKAGDAFVQGDLARFAQDPKARAALARGLRKALGKHKLHVLVNNAATQRLGAAADVAQEDWDATMAVNVSAPLFLAQAFLPDLEASGGSVVNVASIHASLTKPGFVAYAASKAALVGLTKALAVDLGGKVRVNAVAPAAVDTPMLRAGLDAKSLAKLARHHPAGQVASPADVARTVLWLAEGPSFLTGAVVGLDGAIASRLHDPE